MNDRDEQPTPRTLSAGDQGKRARLMQFPRVPVDLFGYRRAGVPDEISDGLDGNAVITHDRHERMAQLAGCPVLPEPCLPGDRLEGPADVGCVQGRPRLAGEDGAVV